MAAPPPITQFEVADFSGGLNVRDGQLELAENETPDALNVTLDERGGLAKRLGMRRSNSVALAGVPVTMKFSSALQVMVLQVGATLYTSTDMATFTSFATLTTSVAVGMCDFTSKLVVVHPTDGVFTYDGVTWALATATVKGTCCATWQNKVFVGGDPSNKARVWWSNLGNASIFTIATDWNDLRDFNDDQITALGAGQGQDIQGRPGLLAFKETSAYRINNASTGAYTTMSTFAGCSGPMALATIDGQTVTFCKNGIFKTDGVSPFVRISDKIQPFFDSTMINFSLLSGVTASIYKDRLVFSFPWGSSQTSNNRTLEVNVTDGWIMVHSIGASAFSLWTHNDSKLYAASSTSAYVFEAFSTWTDDGAAFTAHYQTRWFAPEGATKCNFRRARFEARGTFDSRVKLDYTTGVGELFPIDLTGNGFIWNASGVVWNDSNTMIWGPDSYESFMDIHSLECGNTIAFMFTHSGTSSATGPKLLGDGGAPPIGSFAVYRITIDYVRLGLA